MLRGMSTLLFRRTYNACPLRRVTEVDAELEDLDFERRRLQTDMEQTARAMSRARVNICLACIRPP